MFGKECLPINLPADGGKHVVDCFFNPDGESDFSSVSRAHGALVDQVVEVDEALMAKYLEQGEIAPDELHAPFEKALRDGHLMPVCFVSAKTGAGIPELLDVLVKLAPSPAEGNPPLFYKGEGDAATEFRSEPDPKKHVLAHVFKVVMDPFVGKLGIFRVHQGTVTKDTQLYVGDGRKPFKVGHLFMLQGGKNVEMERAVPGDIAAVAKVDEIDFDCVLHDSHDEDHIHMRPLEFPTADAGSRHHAEEARRRAADFRSAAPDDRRGPDARRRARLRRRTKRCCARWAICTCARCWSGWRASSSSKSIRGRRASRIARRSRGRRRGSIATRSRRAAPASSARCRCASSRASAAPASSSSTRRRAA